MSAVAVGLRAVGFRFPVASSARACHAPTVNVDTERHRDLVTRALARDRAAVRDVVALLTPVVHVRATRALERSGSRRRGRDVRQEVEDLVQEVFVSLFADEGRALRAWDPARGASLLNFVGLVAEHQVASILRTGRRHPWTEEPTVHEALDGPTGSAGDDIASRNLFQCALDRLRAELSPRALELFHALVLDDEPLASVCERTGLSADAAYAWRSRLLKRTRVILSELEAIPPSAPRGVSPAQSPNPAVRP
jgi:DNA-directed RNA polymerase specialized sigma24 family protein